MVIETYEMQIRAIDEQIDRMKKQIREIEDQIEEAQAAKAQGKIMQNEFCSFVDIRKAAAGRPVKGRQLRSFRSFFNKVQSFLNGADYNSAYGLVEEMNCAILRKLNIFEENLDYCKKELRRLNRQREQLVEEYNRAVLTYTAEVGQT